MGVAVVAALPRGVRKAIATHCPYVLFPPRRARFRKA